jgi:DNA-binding SARP family transcriptional activator/predicted ATPase
VPTTLQIHLLGDFRVLAGDQPIQSLNTGRLQTLLTYLLLHRGAPQSRQAVAYLFWPDSSDSQARTNLRNALFQLRAALPDADTFLRVDAQTIQWRADAAYTLDVATFEEALRSAETATSSTAQRTALEEAVKAYGGDLLPGSYDDWLLRERESLQQRYLHALDGLIALLEGQQEYRTAVDYAQRLLQADPLRESTYAKLMQLYAQAGDRAAALRIYHTCTTILARELGVDPDPQTRSIYEHLLNLETPQPTVSHLRDASPLIGRSQAWTALQEGWRQAARGHPTFFLIAGEAGIGKTRLVEELMEWANRQGIATATAHCYAVGGNLAHSSVQEWLRAPALRRARQELQPIWASEVARLLPELLIDRPGLAQPMPLLESWQRQRFFEALARLLLYSNDPLLLALDDIQWCDRDTLEWVQFLLHFNLQARLMIVSTQRQEELTSDPLLAPLLQGLEREGQLKRLELTRLSPEETGQLAANLLGRPLDETLVNRVYTETEGNPLFIVETVRAGMRQSPTGDSQQPTAISLQSLPPKVLAVIESRLGSLTPPTRELASVAAVIGRAFTIEILAQASESSEDALVQGLDELWQQRIIREGGAGQAAESYDFTHDKLREVAYASLSPIRRRYLHRRVAQALETVYAAQLDPVYAQLATHYEAAGATLPAIDAYVRAAGVARQRSAFAEAIRYLQHVLTLLQGLPSTPETSGRELMTQIALGPVLLATKGYAAPEVEQAFTRAWELCQQVGDGARRFQVLWWLSRFYLVQPNLARGLEVSQQLLALAEAAQDDGLLLEAHFAMGTYHLHRGALQEGRHLLEQCLARFDPARHSDHTLTFGQDPWVVGSAYLAWTLWCLGEPAAAQAQVEAGLARAEAINHPYSQVAMLTYACVQQQFLGDPARCHALAEAAIELANRYGFTLWLSMATFLRGWSQTQVGEFEAGFADMQRSIDLYRESGAELGAEYFMGLLAETFGRSGQPDVGLMLMPQALEVLARTEDRWCEAELYRLHGELFVMAEQPDEAEAAYRQAMTTAQAQGARQWELRAAVGLGHLLQRQGRLAEFRPVLAALVEQGTGTGETPELVAARALLDEFVQMG